MSVNRNRPRILGRLDLGELLGVSQQYVSRLIQEEKIPFQKSSAGIVFLESDVLAYQKERSTKAKTDARIRLKKHRTKRKG